MYKNKIVIIICFYGPFPWFFKYFLHSCGFNDTIDFVIFSDTDCNEDVPSNVTIYKQTLWEFQKLASKKLGFEVNINESYKVCDYKPAYGLIFSEYITGYDFWGQSDLDVIYGDIRGFLNDDFLEQYDFVNPRHDYTTGCFMVFRNTPLMNNIFKRSKDYKKVFSNPVHYCFDECNFGWQSLKEGKSIFEIETEIESFTHIMKKAEADQEIRAHFDFILMEGAAGRLIFNKGKIIYRNKFEALLYHLFWFKRLYNPQKLPLKIPDIYFISQSKIYFKRKHIKKKNKWLAISLFSAKNNWPLLLKDGIHPLIKLLSDNNEIISFNLEFIDYTSEHIRLALLVPGNHTHKVAQKTTIYFKDLFKDSGVSPVSNKASSNGLFVPYLNNTVHYDLYSTSMLPASGDLLTLQQVLCQSMLEAFSEDIIDDDLILTFCLYVLFSCYKVVPESERLLYARLQLKRDETGNDLIEGSCNDLYSCIGDIYNDVMNPSTENTLEWLTKWENSFKKIYTAAFDISQGFFCFTQTINFIHQQLDMTRSSIVLLNRLVLKTLSECIHVV